MKRSSSPRDTCVSSQAGAVYGGVHTRVRTHLGYTHYSASSFLDLTLHLRLWPVLSHTSCHFLTKYIELVRVLATPIIGVKTVECACPERPPQASAGPSALSPSILFFLPITPFLVSPFCPYRSGAAGARVLSRLPFALSHPAQVQMSIHWELRKGLFASLGRSVREGQSLRSACRPCKQVLQCHLQAQ